MGFTVLGALGVVALVVLGLFWLADNVTVNFKKNPKE